MSKIELRRFEHSALVQVHGWSDVPRGRPLFESIVVVENYPVDAALAGRAERLPSSVRMGDVQGAGKPLENSSTPRVSQRP